MTITLPNFFLENSPLYQIIKDERFVCAKSVLHKKGKLSIRICTHMLIIVKNGEKILHLKKEDKKVQNNEIIFLTQGNYFMSEIVSKDNSYETILICFDDKFILEFIKKYKLQIQTNLHSDLVIIKKDPLINLNIESLDAIFEIHPSNTIELLKLKTEELFLYALAHNEKILHSFLSTIIETSNSRIKYILESNLDIIQNLHDMCTLTRLSESSLRKEIYRLYNTTPKKWLDSSKLHRAAQLLKNTDHTIATIATTCGYSNVSWFISQFKKHYKSTPFLYRKEN